MQKKIPFFIGNPLCQSVDFLYASQLCGGHENVHVLHQSLDGISAGERFFIPLSIVHQMNLDPASHVGDHPQFGDTYLLDRLSEQLLEMIRNGAAILFIDYSGEALQCNWAIMRAFHAELSERRIPANYVVICNENYSFNERYVEWCREEEVAPVHIITYNHALYQFSGTITANQSEERDARLLHVTALQANQTPRGQIYACLNNMPRVHRYALVAYLRARNFSNKGWLSCLLKADPEYFDAMWLDVQALTSSDPLRREDFDRLINDIPLEADRKFDTNRGDLSGALGGADMYHSTYISFVTESECGDESIIRVTEKIYKPMANLHPYLLFGPPRALSILREAGFRSLHPYIDEGYDGVVDSVERFTMLLTLVKKFCSMSQAELMDFTDQVWDVMVHNYNHLWDSPARYASDKIHDDSRKILGAE